MKVIGVREVDYESKKTGKPVRGVEVYVSYEDKKIVGVGTERLYVSEKYFPDVCHMGKGLLGKEVHVSYNKYGNIEAFEF